MWPEVSSQSYNDRRSRKEPPTPLPQASNFFQGKTNYLSIEICSWKDIYYEIFKSQFYHRSNSFGPLLNRQNSIGFCFVTSDSEKNVGNKWIPVSDSQINWKSMAFLSQTDRKLSASLILQTWCTPLWECLKKYKKYDTGISEHRNYTPQLTNPNCIKLNEHPGTLIEDF